MVFNGFYKFCRMGWKATWVYISFGTSVFLLMDKDAMCKNMRGSYSWFFTPLADHTGQKQWHQFCDHLEFWCWKYLTIIVYCLHTEQSIAGTQRADAQRSWGIWLWGTLKNLFQCCKVLFKPVHCRPTGNVASSSRSDRLKCMPSQIAL